MRDQDFEEGRRQPGESMEDWRPRRDALARQLAGLGAPVSADELARLGARIAELEAAVSALLSRAAGPVARRVELADGRHFLFAERDFLALAMAAVIASRTGDAVDVPLTNGSVAEKLRLGEIAEIARQLIEMPA